MPKIKNYGFIPIDPVPEDYILGAYTKLSAEILQPTGQWNSYLPEKELQERNGLETSNCTNYGTLNCLETLHKRLFDIEKNWSERYTGVMTGTMPEGNNVQTVIEKIRKECGLIPENVLPFDDKIRTWEQYYSPCPMSEQLVLLGKNWLLEYLVGHEWLFGRNDKNKIARLKEGLKYSPIGVSVYAWQQNEQGLYYKPDWAYDNHWVMLYGYEEGCFWRIFDHYDNTFKKLVWNYDFGFAKRYFLEKKIITEPIKKEFSWSGLEICRIIKEKLLQIQRSLAELGKKLFGKK